MIFAPEIDAVFVRLYQRHILPYASSNYILQMLMAAGARLPALKSVTTSENMIADNFFSFPRDILHPFLQPDSFVAMARKSNSQPLYGSQYASLSVNAVVGYLLITQPVSLYTQTLGEVNATFDGLLKYAKAMATHLNPDYGLIDDSGPEISHKMLSEGQIPYVGWANFFGPALVDKLGRSFLQDAPVWQVADLPNGGVVLVATETYLEWRCNPDFGEFLPYSMDARIEHPLARHFQRHYPDLILYSPNVSLD